MSKKIYESMPWLKNGDLYDPGSPWAIETNELKQKMPDASLETCRDYVILKWLFMGDTKPLATLLSEGVAPAKEVLIFLAKMLHPDELPIKHVPFELKTKNRNKKPGRSVDPENIVRDKMIHKYISEYMEEAGRGSYDSAVKTVAEFSKLGEQTVRDAYDKLKKK